jgi:hypothetical protein
MKVHVKHTLKTETSAAFKLCTEQKAQESLYQQLGGTDQRIKREGRAPKIKLMITRRMPANPPAALRKLVPASNDVSHTEAWSADGEGYSADINVEIKGVPVRIVGTKSLQPTRGGCSVEWNFEVSSAIPLLGSVIAGFAGEEIARSLEREFKILQKMI